VTGCSARANPPRAILDELKQITADKLFINMSVFQSLPDIWAIDQVFPIMPAQRLDEPPTRRGVLRDLTCDSDGRVDLYVHGEGIEHSLPVHTAGRRRGVPAGGPDGGRLPGNPRRPAQPVRRYRQRRRVPVALRASRCWACRAAATPPNSCSPTCTSRPTSCAQRTLARSPAAGLDEEDQSYFLRALSDGLSGYTYLED
jgi:arginine decarboxylase